MLAEKSTQKLPLEDTKSLVRKAIGIIDFNPDQNPDKRQYVERISALVPQGVATQGMPFRQLRRLSDFDALILTGSRLSAANYQCMVKSGKAPGDEYLSVDNVVKELRGYTKPLFGICFGAQLIAHLVGGEIGSLAETEAGYLTHQLTEEGKKDPLFRNLPPVFYGAHLHTDYVANLPKGGGIDSRILATRNGHIHAFRIGTNNTFYYGTQFHPEMSNKDDAAFLVRANSALSLIHI